MPTPTSRPDPGSFRDPLSRVFVDDAGVWRGLSKEALADFEALAASTFFAAALDRGDIVGTERVDDPRRRAGHWAAVLRHERIDVLSYPYEWPFEMLRDAARLQLALTRGALAEKLITKDASPYNVQFVGTRPVFIDVGSFERLRPSEPWPGYRQFCELFLNPLLIQAVRDVPFQPLLRGSIHGISPATAADLLRGTGGLHKGVFTHVKLHARAERRYADADRERDVKAELEQAGFGPGPHRRPAEQPGEGGRRADVEAAGVDVVRLRRPRPLPDRDLQAKEAFVAAATIAAAPPRLVLDLGANDGRFSRLAVAAGAQSVVAVDSDDLVVDRLYRDLGPRASGGSCRSCSTSPTRRPASAGGAVSGRRSSSGCGPTSCCASPSSTTWRSPTPCRSTRSSPSSPTSVRRSWSSSPTATTRWRPASSPASGPACSTPTTSRRGSRRSPAASRCGHRETLPSGTRTLYRCDPA